MSSKSLWPCGRDTPSPQTSFHQNSHTPRSKLRSHRAHSTAKLPIPVPYPNDARLETIERNLAPTASVPNPAAPHPARDDSPNAPHDPAPAPSVFSRRHVLLAGAAPATLAAASTLTTVCPQAAWAAELQDYSQVGSPAVFALVAPPGAAVPVDDGAEDPSAPPGSPASRPRRFSSLGEAVAACPAGGVVLVAAGRYEERLVLTRPVTLRAWPQGARVEVVWQTNRPYESAVEIEAGKGAAVGSGGQIELQGLTIRHSSKSVANNYGVYIKAGAPLIRDCDISSATGAGVGVEGASPELVACRIHDCARQGIAIFGALAPPEQFLDLDPGLMYGMTGGVVRDCDVYGNALDGVLVRGGASPDLLDNLIHNNMGVGVNLQDCAGRYEGNTVYDNARGAVAVSALFELDAGELAGVNSLKGLLRRL